MGGEGGNCLVLQMRWFAAPANIIHITDNIPANIPANITDNNIPYHENSDERLSHLGPLAVRSFLRSQSANLPLVMITIMTNDEYDDEYDDNDDDVGTE